MTPSKLNIVKAVLSKTIKLQCCSENLKPKLVELGGHNNFFTPSIWKISYSNEKDLAKILQELRNFGFLMSGGSSGWPPAEVFKHLRSKNLVEGAFKEVVWKSKDMPVILDC